jgi:hypothetical protein
MSFQFNSDKEIIKGVNPKLIGSNELTIRSGEGASEKEIFRAQLDSLTGLPRIGINRTGRRVESIRINAGQGGSGYSLTPNVTLSPPDLSDGVQALASAIISNGSVVAIIVDEVGDGYLTAPSVTITGGNGAGAAATAVLDTVDFELDINGAIRTSTSIISDTARILNLDIDNFITPDASFRGPNLKTWANNTGIQFVPNVILQKGSYRYAGDNIYQALNTGTLGSTSPFHTDGIVLNGEVELKHIGYRVSDENAPHYNQTGNSGIFPRSITPELGDRSDKIATTEYVLNLATNDVGGRVYVSAQIGNDQSDGRSAVAPVRTIKRACQIASATVGIKETVIISGGDYVEDNPISIPADCSIVGDNLRLVIVRPANPRKHMFKFGDKNYLTGLVFRDQIDSNGDPVATWDFAMVFDDKQRIYYDSTTGGDFERNFPIGHQVFGPPRIRVTFQNHTGGDQLIAGLSVSGINTGSAGLIAAVTFESTTGPDAYVNGTIDVDITSGSFNTGETFEYTIGVSPSEETYELISTDIRSIRAEGEVVSQNKDLTTSLPIVRIDFSKQGTPETSEGGFQYDPLEDNSGGIIFYTNELVGRQNVHNFKEGQEIQIEGLPESGPDLSFLNGKQRIYKILRDADGRSRRFVIQNKQNDNLTDSNFIPNNASVKSYDYSVTLSLLNSPNKFGVAESVSRRFQDACILIRNNIPFIVDEAYLQIKQEFSYLNVPNEAKCRRDIGHFVNALIRDLEYGGNYNVIEAAQSYIQNAQVAYLASEITESVKAYEIAKDLSILAMRRWRTGNGQLTDPLYIPQYSSIARYIDPTVIQDSVGAACEDVESAITTLGYVFTEVLTNNAVDRFLDASELIARNTELITEEAIGRTLAEYPTLNLNDEASETNRFKDAANLIFANKQEIQDKALAEISVEYSESAWGTDWVIPGDTISQANKRYLDSYRLIQKNKTQIVDDAWTALVAQYPGVSSTQTKCKRDLGYFVDAVSLDVFLGGNKYARKFTLQYFNNGSPISNGLVGEETQSVYAFNQARDLMKSAITNQLTYKDLTITADPVTGSNTSASSCSDVRTNVDNLVGIITTVITAGNTTSLPTENAGTIFSGSTKCRRDIGYFTTAIANDLVSGGNSNIIEVAQSYFNNGTPISNGLVGEVSQSVIAFNKAKAIIKLAITNQLYSKDLTITADPVTGSNIDINSCANVQSAVDTLASIAITAVTNGNLNSLPTIDTGTFSGYITCKRDIRYILSAIRRDLTLGGNAGMLTAAEAYFTGAQLTGIPEEELSPTRYAFTQVRDLAILAMRNWKTGNGTGPVFEPTYTIKQLYIDNTITIDPSTPICANVASAITTSFTLLDDVLSGTIAPGASEKTYGTLYDTVNILSYPDNTLYDAENKRITPRATWDDFPTIEASPYTQNASVISFLGGSGALIDGTKVAQPNCPFPGLELDGSASFPNQGKSMVAAAFTIVSFNGTGYKIINDGYVQLVSVFVLFAADGVLAETGGYASITNSATNFGIYALRATGYNNFAYSFDIGTIVNVSTTPTGRTIFTVDGLGREPLEHYVVKIDGYSNVNPEIEYFIDVVAGVTVGPPFSAQITIESGSGDTAEFIRDSDNVVVSTGIGEFSGKTIRLHRPSIVNSSSHTWEYAGSGTNYNALPENGGTKIDANEQVSQDYGRVYCSGTDELGDFKVGTFAKIENRTGNITFTGTVTISEVEFLKLKGGDVVVTGFDNSNTLGGANSTDSKLPTQKAVRDYITNNLGPFINKPYSTNAVPRALVELTDSGKISIDQIPPLRPFNVYTVDDQAERLSIEGALAGDIAIQQDTGTSYILNNDNDSLFVTFPIDTDLEFNIGDIFLGSISEGQIQSTEYRTGVVYQINLSDAGSGYVTPPTVTISGGNPEVGAVQASAVATIANGQVVTVQLVEFNGYVGGKGYTTPPSVIFSGPGGAGVAATGSALIESRLYGDIVNNVKITDTDTIVSSNSPQEIVNINRVVNTSANIINNWVSLSTTQISATDITSGVISTSRLANNSDAANSFTFLRGDQAYAPVLQSIKGAEVRYFAKLTQQANSGSSQLVFSTNSNTLLGHSVIDNVSGIAANTNITGVLSAAGITTVSINNPLTQNIPSGTIIEFLRGASPLTFESSLTQGNFVDGIVIANGGSGYTSGQYFDVGFTGGSGTGLRGNIIVSDGVITDITVTNSGVNYTSDFNITSAPAVIGSGVGLVLAAKISTVNRQYANTSVDIQRVTDLTISADAFGTVGVSRFLKSQFLLGQSGNGSVQLKTGPDSGLDADLLDGAQGAFYLNASNLNSGTVSTDRLSGTYNISISGQSGNTLRLISSISNPTSNPAPSNFAAGVISDTKNNSADGLNDGGTRHLVMSIRNGGAGFDTSFGGVRQLAFTDNDNMWLRGSGNSVTEFGSWGKVWTSLNDGPGTDLDADRLDNRQGTWYQNALNINFGTISDNRLPTYQTTKSFNNSVKVLTTTNNPRYKIYLSGVLLTTAPFLAGLEVNLYNANGQGTGTILITNVETIDDANDNSNDYTLITGSLQTGTFIDALTIGTASNRIAFQDFSLDVSGTYQTASLDSDGGVARLRLGRKDGFSSSPTIYFNSSQLAATNYNAAIVASSGNATDGSGSLNVIVSGANGLTVNNNAVWNAGNVTFNSTNVASTAVIRDASGNFAAGTISAALTGAASLNVLKTGDTMTGSLLISGASSNLTVGGTLGVTGTTTLTANLIVDTNTLYVNATDNLVGIGKVPTSAANTNSKIQVFSGALGTALNDTSFIASFETSSGNYSRLSISQRRHTAGADWTTTSTRIQQRIDVTDQGYIEFNPSGSLQGVAIGSGAVEGLRLISTGEIGIGKTPSAGFKLDVSGIVRASTSVNISDASANSGAPILFLGSSGFRNFRVGNQLLANDVFEITPSTAAGGSTWASTPALAIRGADGNIAIGSTTFANPGNTISYKLNVNGNINFNGTLYQNDVAFVTSRWTESSNGTDVHRLSKVGINKANPTYTLDVGGDINLTGIMYVNTVAQWIDSKGIIKTTSNNIAENVTIPASTNATSTGPLVINTGNTITVSAGAVWTIV